MPVPESSAPSAFPKLHHLGLETTFCGTVHKLSTSQAAVHQYLGIRYAEIPARFRQSKLCTAESYPPITDASKHGSICPQLRKTRPPEEQLFGLPRDEIPVQNLKQDEFECLNLNITCPAGLSPNSRIPVMLWVHGGGDRGSGSEWFYDSGAIVRKSIVYGKPVLFVTFNFRIGLLGFATSAFIRDDNKAAGEDGTGNYGLRDQKTAMEWLHNHIGEFGGDPSNITLVGSGSGAADIICHLLSAYNSATADPHQRLFARCIIQSPIFEPVLPDVGSAGWALSRSMSALGVSGDIDKLRKVQVDKLLNMGPGQTIRAVDDGVWFREGWMAWFIPTSSHPPSTPQPPPQPIILGDTNSSSLLWSHPISHWTSSGVVRRLKAICQSLSKTSNILRAYDINSYTADEEIMDRVLELVDDARVGWPTHVLAESIRRESEDRGLDHSKQQVWRYVFDQEGPARGVPHYASDLMYLFDVKPSSLDASSSTPSSQDYKPALRERWSYDGPYEVDESEEEEKEKVVASQAPPSLGSLSFEAALSAAAEAAAAGNHGHSRIDPHALARSIITTSASAAAAGQQGPVPSSAAPQQLATIVEDAEWLTNTVDDYAYRRVRDTMQEKWLAFAYGESPWTPWERHQPSPASESTNNMSRSHQAHLPAEKVFVFGPEGETGERSSAIFEGRRRRGVWSEVLEPLGWSLVQKFGVELSRGPALGADRSR